MSYQIKNNITAAVYGVKKMEETERNPSWETPLGLRGILESLKKHVKS